jgi:hypothetical protein
MILIVQVGPGRPWLAAFSAGALLGGLLVLAFA